MGNWGEVVSNTEKKRLSKVPLFKYLRDPYRGINNLIMLL